MITQKQIDDFCRTVERWRLGPIDFDELVSTTLERFLEKRGIIHDPARWLLVTAKYVLMEMRRKRRVSERARNEFAELFGTGARVNGCVLERVPRADGASDENRPLAERRRICTEAISKLAPRNREIIELCGIMALMPGAAAKILGIPRSTAKSRFKRALLRLRGDAALQSLLRGTRFSAWTDA